MIALALLATTVFAAAVPIPPEAWAEPQQSLRTISGFRIRVDVHAKGQFAAMLGERVHQQIDRSLRLKNIQVVDAPEGARPTLDGTGVLVVDVHVLDASDGTAVAWSLHASQVVHLRTGAFAFASTWEVGDLFYAPTAATVGVLRGSLQPAIEELCALYLASRASPPPPPTEPAPSAADL
jgi:hypothetical protein